MSNLVQAQPPSAALAERTDEALMAAYQGGDVAAFRVLAERHHGPVYRFCLRATGAPEAAADATQEVFLRVVKNADRWSPQAKFTTWMYTIARNHCIDLARRGRHRRTESLDAPLGDAPAGETHLDRVTAETPSADSVAASQRLRATIDRAVQALPEEQRAVFLLRQHAQLGFREIAESTGIGINTVKSRMRYALSAVRDALRAAGYHPPDTS